MRVRALTILWCILGTACTATQVPPALPKELEGLWSGRLSILGTETGIVLELSAADPGRLEARLHAHERGLSGIPAGKTLLEGRKLDVTFPTLGARYIGRLGADRGSLRGDWLQSGAKFRLPLARVDRLPLPPRPQEPIPPFPYSSDSVRFSNSEAGVSLAGTLTVPRGEGPFPAVVLVSGSGPQDRDETIFGHRPFLVLADHLTRAGIAVLRYDDRGMGGSTGTFHSATTEDFASDALAGISYLARRPGIDASRVGLIGHSEGGIVGPMVAVRSDRVAFLVLLAPTGMTGRELIPLQTNLILKASGVPESLIRLNRRVQTELLERTLVVEDSDYAGERLRKELDGLLGGFPREALTALGISAQINRAIDDQMRQLGSPWIRFFLAFDPVPTLEQVSVPVLALFGSKDLQVPAEPNLPLVRGALERGGNPDVTVMQLAGLNHMFQSAVAGTPAEYGTLEETIDPEALATITDWVRVRTGLR